MTHCVFLVRDTGKRYKMWLTACNDAVDQWLFPLKEVFIEHLLPVIAMEYKLILEEINIGSLIPT